jgi:hypothetical protein
MNMADKPAFEMAMEEMGSMFNYSESRLNGIVDPYFKRLMDVPFAKVAKAIDQ